MLRSLHSVHKLPTGALEVYTPVVNVTRVDGVDLFSKPAHRQNFCYVSVDAVKRCGLLYECVFSSTSFGIGSAGTCLCCTTLGTPDGSAPNSLTR
jgi:hypothetical protein